MRTLLLMRGAPGSGKSTWIKNNGLKPYTLCADYIRLLCQSPVLKVDGTSGISQENDKMVWEILFDILERRMQKGEFTVIDATNSKTSEMIRYKKLCDEYRYRIYCVDFTIVPIEVAKERNMNRDSIKRVPEEVIDKMYARFPIQKVPSGIKVIRPDQLKDVFFHIIDLSDYKKVHHIGDVHGCNAALQMYFDHNGGLKDDEYYIFTGDYIDRGIENVEVLKFLLSIMDKKNVLLLEGNHERWLRDWTSGVAAKSKEFEFNTKLQIEKSGISKKDICQLCRKFAQCAYYRYDDKIVLVSHGGISNMPSNLSFTATEQLIKGVGHYDDHEKVDEAFKKNTPDNFYQIHGHRNVKCVPLNQNDRTFNLEGQIEFGGDLRCVRICHDSIEVESVKNPVFKHKNDIETGSQDTSVKDFVCNLRNNGYIRENKFGNFSSFNFTRKAFYKDIWDNQTVKARGLYIDINKNKIAARAYNKFFNINERSETKLDSLKNTLKFPVTAYVKENGFLGMVSWDEYKDDLLIASKSRMDGEFAGYFKDILYAKLTQENLEKMKKYIKDNDVTFVFECVDIENDPHVIEYPESDVFLLDIVKNQIDFEKYDYEQMRSIAEDIGLSHKEKACEIASWQDFIDWREKVLESDYKFNGRLVEGFVIEDASGFMIKLKLSYYNFWKFMRGVAQETFKNGYYKRVSSLSSPLANEFYGWCKGIADSGTKDIRKDICSLRKAFYKDKEFC